MSFLNSAGLFNAIPDSVIDNFNSALYEDQGNTLSDYYSGANSAWSRSTSNVVEGDQGLLGNDATSPSVIYSQPGDGLNSYPSEGDTIGWLVYEGGDVRGGPVVAATTNGEGYLYSASGFVQILRIDSGGGFSTVASDQTSYLSQGEWGWCEARVPSSGDSTLSLTLYDLNEADLTRGSELASISGSDSNYVGQGVGWARGSDSNSHIAADWLRVL